MGRNVLRREMRDAWARKGHFEIGVLAFLFLLPTPLRGHGGGVGCWFGIGLAGRLSLQPVVTGEYYLSRSHHGGDGWRGCLGSDSWWGLSVWVGFAYSRPLRQ